METVAAEATYERERSRQWQSISRHASDLFASAQALQAPFRELPCGEMSGINNSPQRGYNTTRKGLTPQ